MIKGTAQFIQKHHKTAQLPKTKTKNIGQHPQ